MNEQEQIELLGKAMALAMKQYTEKANVINAHSAVMLHDGTGIFSTCGLSREVLTAHITPTGIGPLLPLRASVDTDPRYATVTGFTAETGTNPTQACDAAPSAYTKGCELTARFGLIRKDTNTIEFDQVMLRYNRGDFQDLQLFGGLLGYDQGTGMVPTGLNPQQVLNIVTMAEMVTAGVLVERDLTNQMWQGNVALGQFPGLDFQIATGQVDASTNTLCPALDSDVKDFGYDDVCGTGRDIVEYMSMMAWFLQFNASRMGLAPVKWVVVMRPELWYELTACWPCRYLSNRCQDSAGTQLAVINDENNTRLRDNMRDGMFIQINGIKYDVVVDDGIFEHNSTNNANLQAGEFASSIYFVPLTILNGAMQVTYREYLNYRDPIAEQNVALLRGRQDFWTDNGIYSWAIDQIRWCYVLGLKTEQRVILRTPQLAGKIQSIAYTPLQHLRSSDPTSSYWQDGGLSVRPVGTRYSVWASGGVGRG